MLLGVCSLSFQLLVLSRRASGRKRGSPGPVQRVPEGGGGWALTAGSAHSQGHAWMCTSEGGRRGLGCKADGRSGVSRNGPESRDAGNTASPTRMLTAGSQPVGAKQCPQAWPGCCPRPGVPTQPRGKGKAPASLRVTLTACRVLKPQGVTGRGCRPQPVHSRSTNSPSFVLFIRFSRTLPALCN